LLDWRGVTDLLHDLSMRFPHARPQNSRERRGSGLSDSTRSEYVYPPQIAFLSTYGATPAVLLAATKAARCGVTSEQALLGEGLMREETYYRALARQLRAPYCCGELAISADARPAQAVASGITRLAPNSLGLRVILAPRGDAIAMLLAAAEAGRLPASFVICAPQRIASILRSRMGETLAREAAQGVAKLDPALSARTGPSSTQRAFVVGALILAIPMGLWAPQFLGLLISIVIWLVFAAAVGMRLAAMSANRTLAPAPSLDDADLPVYSIIVPLYKEAEGIPRLVAAPGHQTRCRTTR
jgi:glycosyltransferase XagB